MKQHESVFSQALGLICVGVVMGMFVPRIEAESAPEPNVEIASQWWPPMTNVYTPLGWKNHLFRFNLFYNGMLMADPAPVYGVPALEPWRGQGVQVWMIPSINGKDPDRWRAGTYQMTADNGRRWGYQGMLDRPTPVIWTEWRNAFRATQGYTLRQEVFAHVPGGEPIESGTEPLFAWVRFSIAEINPVMDPPPCGILVKINKPHVHLEMYEGRNVALRTTDARYPRELALETHGDPERSGWRVTEPDGRIRLGVLPGDVEEVTLASRQGDKEQHTNLHVVIPARKGAYVDLLVPMLPAERDVYMAEAELGRDAALAQADAYWSRAPETLATIDTPEPYVNNYLKRNLQYAELIAQRMPDTGHYTNLTGSWAYARMWATPTTMFHTMLLDALGRHESVERYLQIFKDTQGTVKPPGPAFDVHPGYFATPKSLTSIDWLSDHGAVLHAVAYHALLTNDREFIDEWIDPILKACDFIKESRAKTNHDGVPGVLPPAVATDRSVPNQAIWNIGWHYRGLATALRLLERIDHPRAAEFGQEAEEYRTVFIEALREETKRMPTWTDRTGKTHHMIPTSLSEGGDIFHAFYLDTGPLFLVYAGLLDADSELMRSTVKFFREGPNHVNFDPHGHFDQPAVLVHEISSCEPPASFNLFHTHQLGDRMKYLEGMYSMITGAHSRKTYISCETRGGITGLCGHIGIYTIRLAVVDDLVDPDELHLLRLTPKAWIRSDRPTRFENIPTLFGPVSVRFQLGENGSTLRVETESRYHHPPQRVRLHVPPIDSIETIVYNGVRERAQPGDVLEVSNGPER